MVYLIAFIIGGAASVAVLWGIRSGVEKLGVMEEHREHPEVATDVQLSITCDNVALPMAYHGDLWILNTVMMQSGGGLLKHMTPSKNPEGLWPEEGVHGFGYRCTVKNHGTQAAFSVSFPIVISVLNIIRTGNAWTTGEAKETHTATVWIPQPLGQQGSDQFSFYVCSYDPDGPLAVTLPSSAFINSDDPKNKREVSVKITSIAGNPFTVPPKELNVDAKISPALPVTPSVSAKTEPDRGPDIEASIVNPTDIAMEYMNNSDAIVKDVRSLVMIWNLDNLDSENRGLLPKANVLTRDLILQPKTYSMPYPIASDPLNMPFVKLGDRLFGIFTATCGDCKNNKGYWIYAVAGKGGWYSPWEKNRHPRPNDLGKTAKAIAENVDEHLDFFVPDKTKRIPIGDQRF